jgi:predicted dehydrogenase
MKIKIGIIGAGNMGKNHIRLTREMTNEFEFVGVFDPDKERVKTLGLLDKYYDTEDALIDASDAIVCAAPSSLHKDIALKVAKAGKHLLMEKPLALSTEDAQEVVDAFKDTKQVLQVGHVERFNPVVLELEKIIKDEEIVSVHIERCSSMDKRISDTDVVYDLMIHDVDILMNSLIPDAQVKKINSLGAKVYSDNYMDYVDSLFSFDNGAIASIISSRATESKIRRAFIHCKNAFIDADLLHRTLTISRKTTYHLDVGYDPVYRQENIVEKVFVSNEEPLKAELKHFYNCIEESKPAKTSGKTALRSIAILDKIKEELY